MAADTEPIEILLHLPLLAEDKVSLAHSSRRLTMPLNPNPHPHTYTLLCVPSPP